MSLPSASNAMNNAVVLLYAGDGSLACDGLEHGVGPQPVVGAAARSGRGPGVRRQDAPEPVRSRDLHSPARSTTPRRLRRGVRVRRRIAPAQSQPHVAPPVRGWCRRSNSHRTSFFFGASLSPGTRPRRLHRGGAPNFCTGPTLRGHHRPGRGGRGGCRLGSRRGSSMLGWVWTAAASAARRRSVLPCVFGETAAWASGHSRITRYCRS